MLPDVSYFSRQRYQFESGFYIDISFMGDDFGFFFGFGIIEL